MFQDLIEKFSSGLYILVFISFGFAQDELPRGEIVERVTAKADATQSYALYLPKNYTPDKKWAILYAFEPVARGKIPVMIFHKAAEKYGFIVVGSHNSQNGLDGGELSKIINNLWTDTHQRFSIDENRIYATGFSGGSRVASGLAGSCKCIAGVIGSGAGFPSGYKPTSKLPFDYYGTFGYDDYNYFEIRKLKIFFDESNTAHFIEKFDGEHQWLSETAAENALAWMQLRAMKKGTLPVDTRFIEDLFQNYLAQAENHLSDQKFIEAFQYFSNIATDFKGLKDVSIYEKKIAELKESEDLKKALRDEAKQIEGQEKHIAYLLQKGTSLQNQDERLAALSAIRNYADTLRKTAAQKVDSSARRIARRSLRGLLAQTHESAVFRYEREKRYDLALANLELAGEVYPQNYQVQYNRSRLYAIIGEKGKSLERLEKAFELGFKNHSIIEKEKAFEKIREEKKFQILLEKMKGK